ncbi:MAG TPA: efflux RND transporter periplasmic adaptor subunit [Candidatus Methylomirabilis sp.]|nr:efflux RND transporter periplasmic adaptor subunit [Candidatus Methylomirabilis sp.]
MGGRVPTAVISPWLVLLAMLGAGVTVSSCDRAETPAAAEAPAAPAKPSNLIVIPPDSPQLGQIEVRPVRLADVPIDEIAVPARIVADPNRVSRLLPPVQGRVSRILVGFGDSVEQGQPLLELESPDADAAIAALAQAQAAERQAQATLKKATTDLARATDLYEHKAIAEKDLAAAQNDSTQAAAGLEAATAGRQQAARKLDLLGLKPDGFQQGVIVRAPISGKVLEINVAPGEYRGAVASHSDTTTTPLMTIADLTHVWMAAEVPESALRFFHVGDPVTISLVAYPGDVFTGHVKRIADVLDPQTRTTRVFIEMPNPGGRLRPDMFGTVRRAGEREQRPVVPSAAVVQEYGRSVVFIERERGRFERRVVKLGPPSGDVLPVLEGVAADDRVVVDGAILLKGR